MGGAERRRELRAAACPRARVEVAICFIIALTSFWQSHLQKGIIPSLTWVPVVVILFPLVLPVAPRRMLMAALAAGAMAPLALLVLDLTGKVPADGGAYFDAVFSSLLAVGFAYMGARVMRNLSLAPDLSFIV